MKTLPLTAEVSGTVCKLVVAAGQVVSADDVVLIIESMKMEIEVVAPENGTVVELLVVEGDAVEEGQTVGSLLRGAGKP